MFFYRLYTVIHCIYVPLTLCRLLRFRDFQKKNT